MQYPNPAWKILHLIPPSSREAEEFGLQVLLDLHGARLAAGHPEEPTAIHGHPQPSASLALPRFLHAALLRAAATSPEVAVAELAFRGPGAATLVFVCRPCMSMCESLRALRIVARRYRGRKAVTGIAVCNEPSPEVPTDVLCNFYDRAVRAIRRAGLREDVTVVLPVFQRPLPGFVARWEEMGGKCHANVCFEVHWYHCFENEWHGRTFAQHLRAVQEHAEELRRFPVVVGEWSLALGCGSVTGKISKDEMLTLFANAQLAAYRESSHGWFFWSWSDRPKSTEWDWQQAVEKSLLPSGQALRCDLPALPPLPPPAPRCPSTPDSARDAANASPSTPTPSRDRRTSRLRTPPRDAVTAPLDPLEVVFDEPASDSRIHLGDTVYLRAFHGRYLDVEGPTVRARYGDRGKWQQFMVCPYLGSSAASSSSAPCLETAGASATTAAGRGIKDGDVICLLAHTGSFVGISGRKVVADFALATAPCAFVVRTAGVACEVHHRCGIFLQSVATSKVLAPNESDPSARDAVRARWKSFGEWQQLVVEKPRCSAVVPRRPRRRSSMAKAAASPPDSLASRRLRKASSAEEEAPGTPKLRLTPKGDVLEAAAVATPSRKRRLSFDDAMSATASGVLEAAAASPALRAVVTPRRLRERGSW
ncbi:exgA [Symbiodinium natans]|uniref:glucan 1,3-beta-glucosidase n=1 Tax=Symbiodinium natans TaxID=878477 RepID=A0A812TRL1_9DINO|nr:exgA [Symbiodinium natans]